MVLVSIADLNDNSPAFSSEMYYTTHDEYNDFDLEVVEVTASDRDEGSNGEVVFSITGGNSDGIFYIDPNSVGHHLWCVNV